VSGDGRFTLTLNPNLLFNIGTFRNINTLPTIKLIFNDPTGSLTLASLPDFLSQLESVQFPALGLSIGASSETWTPTVTSFQLGLLPALPDEGGGGGGSKFSFTLSGKIQNIPLNSPIADFDGSRFSASGHFYSSGVLDFTQLRIEPNPTGGGGGEIIAEPNPEGGSGGGKFNIILQPALRFSYGSLGNVSTAPKIKFTFNDPTGSITLNTLPGYLSQLESVSFPSLGLSADAFAEEWRPTVTTYSLSVGPTYGRDIFRANFDADAVGQEPASSPPGDPAADAVALWNDSSDGNSMLVQGPAGNLATNSLRIAKQASIGNSPIFEGYTDPAFGPYTSGLYRVSWRSLAEATQHYGFAALVAPGNYSAFTVNYSMDGFLKYQDGDGAHDTDIPFTPNTAQRFEALVDLDARSFDLSVDGVSVGTTRPFQHEQFTGIDRFFWEIGGIESEAYAIDDIRISCFANSDTTPPVTNLTLSPAVNSAGWHKTPVTVVLASTDGCAGSGVKEILHSVGSDVDVAVAGGSASLTVAAEGEEPFTYYAVDQAGNLETAKSGTVKIDLTPPAIGFSGSCPATATLKSAASLNVSVNDNLSGVVTQSIPNGSFPLNTATVGQKTVTVTAADQAGNQSSQACAYRVIYDFLGTGGFAAPVEGPPAVNTAKAGSTVPVKWQLPNGSGGFISDPGAVSAVQFQKSACQGFSALENPVSTETSGASGLHYDTATNQFIYNWKTAKSMAGSCYTMILRLNDGSAYNALFSLK